MLQKFVVNDEIYKSYAYKISQCHDLKHDLVNDMYIRLNDVLTKEPEKQISNGYIYLMIRSIFLDGIRKNREFCVSDFPDIADQGTDCLNERIAINGHLNKLSFFDREILLKTSETSLRKMAGELDINYQAIHQFKQKAFKKLIKIWQEEEKEKDWATQ